MRIAKNRSASQRCFENAAMLNRYYCCCFVVVAQAVHWARGGKQQWAFATLHWRSRHSCLLSLACVVFCCYCLLLLLLLLLLLQHILVNWIKWYLFSARGRRVDMRQWLLANIQVSMVYIINMYICMCVCVLFDICACMCVFANA